MKSGDTVVNNQLIDDINLKIIDILKKDASTSFVDIAKRIGVSDATVILSYVTCYSRHFLAYHLSSGK